MADLQNDYNAITWAWKLLKENHEPQDDPEYWDHLLDETEEAITSHEDKIAYQMFGMAVMNILEYRYQSMKRYGDQDHAVEMYLERTKERNER